MPVPWSLQLTFVRATTGGGLCVWTTCRSLGERRVDRGRTLPSLVMTVWGATTVYEGKVAFV